MANIGCKLGDYPRAGLRAFRVGFVTILFFLGVALIFMAWCLAGSAEKPRPEEFLRRMSPKGGK